MDDVAVSLALPFWQLLFVNADLLTDARENDAMTEEIARRC